MSRFDGWGPLDRSMWEGESMRRLVAELNGRPPVFRRSPHVRAGHLHWAPHELPTVYVAPDVYAALQSKLPGKFAREVIAELLAWFEGASRCE